MPGRALRGALSSGRGHCSDLSPLLHSPPSKSSGSAALLALSWTGLLVRIVFPSRAKRQGDIWNKLVGSPCLWSWLPAQGWDVFKHLLWPVLSSGPGDRALRVTLRCVTLVDGREGSITLIYLSDICELSWIRCGLDPGT